MIFIRGKLENIVQVNDKTRLDFSGSFISGESATIASITVVTEAGETPIDITEDKYLDWVYQTNGDKVITVEVTDSNAVVESKDFNISILSTAEDNLFSNDDDIKSYEPELLEWVKDGRDSFLDVHRQAQVDILEEIARAGYRKSDGARYEKDDISNIEEFREMSKFKTLKYIYKGLSNAIDDVFSEKSRDYASMEVSAKKKAFMELDVDGDGETEKVQVFSGNLRRTF